MFLESITVSGFIDIGEPRKEIFRLKQNVNICSISSTFLEGFSVIFDPKYDASYDLTEFIKDQFTGKSFVKVELWQSNEDTLVAFNWLKKTRLVIERDLQKPNQVLVNESVMNINAFHQAIASFGFITIDGFQLHRLLKNEINQISCFSGENLWNLVTGLFNSEGLVQVIDFKQKKRRIINDQIIRQMDQLETELPSKLKIRDEIQQHFKLIRRFNTLVAVNNERKLHHLEKQRDALQNEQTQLIDELKLRSREIGKLQAKHEVQTLERKIREKMLELTHRERKVTPEGLLNGQISDESLTNGISELLTKVLSTQADIVQTLENLDKQNKFTGEHQALQSEIFGHLNAIDWRISLKEVQDKDEFQKRVEMFKQTLSAEERNASEISKEVEETDMKIDICRVKAKELKTLEVEEFVNQTKQHYQAQLPLVKRILALNEGILGNTKEALEIKLQIDIVAMEGGFDSSYVETLMNIETLVMMDQNLSVDYHGPVFQYLMDRSNLDQKLWTQLSPIATIFLFARGTTARQVNRMLVESKRNLGHYVFLGIDEFTPKASTEIPEEIKNLVDSAESLIGINERFGKILKPLLREIVLMKDIESAADNFEHFICSKEARNVFTSGFLSNEILSDIQTESPLLYLQNIYGNVKEYASLMLRIEESKGLKPSLEGLLKKNQEKLLSLRKKALLSKSSLPFKELLDLLQLQFLQKKRLMQKQANIQNMHELEITDEKINFWKIDELEKSRDMRLNELKLKSKEVEIQELTQQVELRISHVTIETGTEILSSCLNKLSHFVDTESSAKLFDMMENYRKSTDVKIEAIRRELSKPSTAAPSSVMKLQIELNETRCRLNEKNSECEVVDHAIKLCSPPGAIDTKLFEAMRNQDITKELDECFKQLQTESSSKINLLSTEQYVHLAQSIKNVNKFNEAPEPMLSRNKLASKSFPLINKFAVKVLKDAISNFRTSFSYVMEDYARKSTLYFYTRGSFDELKEEDFSWNSFDMARLKALDFLVKWGRDSREKVSQSSLSKIKGLLLIAHIINYLSVFKFIIIDESLYNTMDESLAKKLRTFLETVSQFIQIVYLEKADQTMQH